MAELVVRSKRDIIDYVNSHPTGTRRTKILAFIALGGVFVDAYDFTSLGIGIDSLKHQLGLSPFELGSVTAIMAVGAMLGALVGGYVVDKIGRFKLFILDLALFVVAAIGAGLSPNLELLLLFRFLLGVGVGIDMPVTFSFVAEFTNSKDKGKYVNFWQSIWYLAVVSTGLIVMPFYFAGVTENLWRWAVGFGAVPALIVLLLRLAYTEESPMWAAHNLGLHEAGKILEKSYGIQVRVKPDATAEQAAPRRKVGIGEIFTSRFRARTVLASVISGTQAIQYYAVGFYIPVIAAMIFGADTLSVLIATIGINLFGVLGGTTQPFLTHRLGLRKLALIGYVIVAASLIALGVLGKTSWAYVSALLVGLLIFGHSFGPGAQGKTMAALSYPTEIRGAGMGWAEGVSRVGTIIGFYSFPLILASFGLSTTMLLLTLVPIAGLITLGSIRWDPVGQDVETSDDESRGERRSQPAQS
ncbi:MFS transporter [Saccharopolyspora phatthalungensis]|uniref:MFS family permease n=1 Tax=Saccharopolyspora phatthalungensis TaxID=664693 RepID=A0A840QEN3_9PSEU|nr:MFS transporter [Saccharopolyspora phatthalungensis]MBB5158886.1 MFS family permease [Saccharopolyspora phatthalungensis]